jgi:hypothetical protein
VANNRATVLHFWKTGGILGNLPCPWTAAGKFEKVWGFGGTGKPQYPDQKCFNSSSWELTAAGSKGNHLPSLRHANVTTLAVEK